MTYSRIAHLPFVQIVERVLEGKEDEALAVIYLLGISKEEFAREDPRRAIGEFFWARKSDLSPAKLAFLRFCLSHKEHEWHQHFSYQAEELLVWAAEKGYSRITLALIKMGVDPETATICGMRAVSFAAKRGELDVLRACQDAGADFYAEDDNGVTPLMHAAAAGQNQALLFLIEGRDFINAVDNCHQNALIHASRGGHIDCAESLLKAGAESEYVDSKGNTPLIWAVFNNDFAMVDALLAGGATLSPKNLVGQTALVIAESLESDEMRRYLRKRMYELEQAELVPCSG